MKLTVSLFVLLAIVLALGQAQSHNQNWGYLQGNSSLAFRSSVQNQSRFLQVVERRVTYPPKSVVNWRPISAIRAIDQKTNGNGANATIVAGGINQTSVTVLFRSKRGHGINFVLEVYTK